MPELSDELGTETGNGDLEKRHKEHKMYLKVNYKKQILCYLVPEGQAKKKKKKTQVVVLLIATCSVIPLR